MSEKTPNITTDSISQVVTPCKWDKRFNRSMLTLTPLNSMSFEIRPPHLLNSLKPLALETMLIFYAASRHCQPGAELPRRATSSPRGAARISADGERGVPLLRRDAPLVLAAPPLILFGKEVQRGVNANGDDRDEVRRQCGEQGAYADADRHPAVIIARDAIVLLEPYE